jgi:integrase
MGRKLDFHALRYTFATKLAKGVASQRLTQELMRHSDPKLTAKIYTDPPIANFLSR